MVPGGADCLVPLSEVQSGLRSKRNLFECKFASTPHFNSVTNYLSNADMTPILKHLVTVSSLPLKAVENPVRRRL